LSSARWGYLGVESAVGDATSLNGSEWALFHGICVKFAIGVTVFVRCAAHQLRFTFLVVAFLIAILLYLIGRYFHMGQTSMLSWGRNSSVCRNSANEVKNILCGLALLFSVGHLLNNLVWRNSVSFSTTIPLGWGGSTTVLLNLFAQESI